MFTTPGCCCIGSLRLLCAMPTPATTSTAGQASCVRLFLGLFVSFFLSLYTPCADSSTSTRRLNCNIASRRRSLTDSALAPCIPNLESPLAASLPWPTEIRKRRHIHAPHVLPEVVPASRCVSGAAASLHGNDRQRTPRRIHAYRHGAHRLVSTAHMCPRSCTGLVR
ncbi:hypothetical protein C8Q78DRAFT_1056241 [Trametes maxima]|nr:hypothetical protein C8Q78DRAFT_1056241 [Trametes maxima]